MSHSVKRHDRRARKRLAAVAAVATLAPALAACGGETGGTVVNLYGGASAAGFDKIIAACNKEAAGKYTIVGNLLPSDADGQREQFVRRLAAQDTGMDLLGMDVTWTAEFAEAGWIEELTGDKATQATEGTLEQPTETAKWKDKLYGIPKHTNVQLLWYRKSLVPEAPKTWDQMMEMAQKLKDEGKTYQIAFTAAQYEGYVVNVNNMLTAFGATFVNEDSTQATLDEKAVEGLALLNKLATSGLTSASLSNSQEPEVFADLQAGRAAFALNWPYVLSAMRTAGETDPKSKEVADDLGYAPFPTVKEGETPKVTLGGMNYAISTYSEHPEETFEAAMCLRKPEHQLQTALEAGDPPVALEVFEEPEFQKNYPMYEAMLTELKSAVPRPVTPIYQNISTIVSTNLSPPANINPEQDASALNDAIQQAIEGKGILP
jgi:ABC-type glycerol-3-phosphate transport system substrate-binding protein